MPEVGSEDWDVVIAHFLGVDHCGHRYGPAHPEMGRKLKQLNEVVKDVVEYINQNDDTVLFVFGDHGMTKTGDHGGDTDNEVSSALFVCGPKKFSPASLEVSCLMQKLPR